jgi:hypothetical protein
LQKSILYYKESLKGHRCFLLQSLFKIPQSASCLLSPREKKKRKGKQRKKRKGREGKKGKELPPPLCPLFVKKVELIQRSIKASKHQRGGAMRQIYDHPGLLSRAPLAITSDLSRTVVIGRYQEINRWCSAGHQHAYGQYPQYPQENLS